MLSKYNKLIVGIVTGLIIPFIAYALVLMIYDFLDKYNILNADGMAPNFRERTIGLIAIVFNAIPLQFFNKKNWLDAMRGIVFPTLGYVVLWMYLYGYELLNFK